MKKLFFSASNDVIDQVTDLYDFVWPTASAMWNFRWQIKGFVNEVGRENISQQNLLNRFNWGSGIHGANIKRAVLEKSWDEQQEQFAKFLLINLIAIYEGWLEGLQEVLGLTKKQIKQLQFPTGVDRDGNLFGVNVVLTQLANNRSTLLQNAFYAALRSHNKNSFLQLENLLICFRFFKECRNSVAHRGGTADDKTYESYIGFAGIASPSNLNVDEVPEHFPVVVGEPVKLSLRGVVGLGDIIIKLVATLDAELSTYQKAENELVGRFKLWSISKSGKSKNSLKKDPSARNGQLLRILRALGFPEPIRNDEIEALLLQEGILKENYAKIENEGGGI